MMHSFVFAQNIVGKVYGADNKKTPIPGAVVGWVNSPVYTVTDDKGSFSLKQDQSSKLIYAAFLGYVSDTVSYTKQKEIKFTLKVNNNQLEEVVVRDNESASIIKAREASLTQLITAKELTKAACCNLSESFETNPAIDASFTDAVTGTRQIKLLGLDGPYSYYTRGNIPVMGGVASVLGLQLIPGSWIQNIQLTKGSGSVINGFESVAGQVNYELRKPDGDEQFYGQLYGNAGGRLEQSGVYSIVINDKWSTNLMAYGRQNTSKPDFNNDGFLDNPQGNMWIGQNTWKYNGTNGWESQFGVKFASNNQVGGQMAAVDAQEGDQVWRAFMDTKRLEYWQKVGYVFKNSVGRTMGLQVAYNYHDQTADFGLPTQKTYGAIENSAYANLIFQDIIKTTDHAYKAGISFKYLSLNETYLGTDYFRTEKIPGIFLEYTYLLKEALTVVAGMRLDDHNLYGAFFTPRLHIRFEPFKKHTFRFNVGKAYRTPNLFADNIGGMASNRMWQIETGDVAYPYYGLKQEESINAGISYAYSFELDYRPGSFRVEYFYTTFENQLVKDWDAATNQLNFYNLNGQSFAHSAQVQLDYEVFQRFNARIAYRFVDAQTTYRSIGLSEQPFISKHRFFTNLEYKTKNSWKFDATLNTMSSQRLPTTESNPAPYQRGATSPVFSTLNVQIAKDFYDRLEVHIGVENAFDYRQDNPIVAADNPFAPEFDASMVWGPVMGRVIYAGIRLKLLKKKTD